MHSRWVVALAVAAMVLVADTLLWAAGLHLLRVRTATWIAQADAHGWSVSAGEQTGGGWPFAAVLSVDRAAVGGGERDLPGGLSWSADRVTLSVGLARPWTLRVAAEGQQFLRLSHLPDVAFTAGSATAWLPLLARNGPEGRFEAAYVGAGIAGSSHPQDVQVAALSVDLRQDAPLPSAAGAFHARLDVRASGIGLPDIGRWPLGDTISSAGATILLASPPLPGRSTPLAPGQTRAAAQVTAWRDGGGSLALREAELRWGPLMLHGRAELHLDQRLQPAGSGTADVAGTEAALDAAVKGGLLSQGVALAAQAALAVMPGVAGSDAVRLPFVLRDSTVSIGGIPVATVGTVGWERASKK